MLLFVSILPVVIIGIFVYLKDYNKEPLNLLLKLFIAGIGSIFITFILDKLSGLVFPYYIFENKEMFTTIDYVIYAFIKVALIEEFSKWIMVYKVSYNNKEFDEFYDMIVYSVFVALGFACLENILYVYSNGIGTGILRMFLAVPGHACDGIFMGYYLGLAKLGELNNNKSIKRKNMILSLIVPMLMHGIYDFCLFIGKIWFLLIFIIFVIILFSLGIKKIKKISTIKRKMKYKDNYCPNCGIQIESDYCPNCGRKNE